MSDELHNGCGAVGTPRPTKTIDKPVGTAVPSRPDSFPSSAVEAVEFANSTTTQPGCSANPVRSEIGPYRLLRRYPRHLIFHSPFSILHFQNGS